MKVFGIMQIWGALPRFQRLFQILMHVDSFLQTGFLRTLNLLFDQKTPTSICFKICGRIFQTLGWVLEASRMILCHSMAFAAQLTIRNLLFFM